MYKLKNSLIAFVGLSLLLGAIALVAPRPTQGQGGEQVGPTKPVEVVNSPSEPVPVTGTINVSNLGNSPLPVRNVDEPGRSPYQETDLKSLDPGGSATFEFAEVPARKRLVIKHVSGQIVTPVGSGISQIQLFPQASEGHSVTHYLDAHLLASRVDADLYAVSEEVLVYVEAGAKPKGILFLNTTSPAFGQNLTISGYFVDVP